MALFRRGLALLWLCVIQSISAIDVDWGDPDSVKAAAATTAAGMMSYYVGNQYGQTPGILPGPYYWWEAGAMWGSLIDYWHYTGDSTYNDLTMQGLQWQVGPHNDFMPPNASASLGNDDQAFWGMAAMAAAEYRFPNPAQNQPSWLSLAQAVFNEQIGRWDTVWCNGGLRWQIYEITGYNLKNSISNGCLINIAARLARYTNDDMYAQWVEKIWDWMWAIGLIDNENYGVYDNSAADPQNCTTIDKAQWTYNAGTLLMGASTMWNYTQSELWRNRTTNLLSTIAFDYFPNGVMKDICEQNNVCNVDQRSFKAYLSRWMAATTQMAPWTYDIIAPLLLSSAKAAAAQCTGQFGNQQNVCGLKWYDNGTWDGTNGVGQQMAAMEVILATMVDHVTPAVTNTTGGNSASNPNAGYNASSIPPNEVIIPPTKGDKAAAWFLTALFSLAALYMWWFMNTNTHEWRNTSRPTVLGKTGRKGRTLSTFDIDTGAVLVAAKSADSSGTLRNDDAERGVGIPQERERSLGVKRGSNVLTKPERASTVSTFSSTGIFPADASRTHNRSASYVSDASARRDSLRGLPPIVERDASGRRSRGLSDARGSRFREDVGREGGSRLD